MEWTASGIVKEGRRQAPGPGLRGTLQPERDRYTHKEESVKPSRLAFYIILALLTAGAVLYALCREPELGCPINLIYLLFKG